MVHIDPTMMISQLRLTGAQLKQQFLALRPYIEREEMMSAFRQYDDVAANTIKTALGKAYPHIGWQDGELDDATVCLADGHKPYWICDAIDGAVQFLRAIPQWCMSLTLIENNQPTFTVIFDVMHDALFYAISGQGAFLNNQPIKVNPCSTHSAAIVATSQPPFINDNQTVIQQAGQSLSAVLANVGAVRNLGPTSLQLAYVACGRLDAFWAYGKDTFNCIGGALLIREAGGIVTDTCGASYSMTSTSIVAGTGKVHSALIALLHNKAPYIPVVSAECLVA